MQTLPEQTRADRQQARWLLLGGLLLTALLYWPGLQGGFLLDDHANIVDNPAIHAEALTAEALARAAGASPAAQLPRPLAMLSFAVNHALTGLDPFWMKLSNLAWHLLNAVLLYAVLALLLRLARLPLTHPDGTAALIAVLWALSPINVSSVLYVVQRMELMGQFGVLLGMYVYLLGRRRQFQQKDRTGLTLVIGGILGGCLLGAASKESALLLPAYLLVAEICLLRFGPTGQGRSLGLVFLFTLLLPGIAGLGWLLPAILSGDSYAAREFTLAQRLLTEARVLVDYLRWIVLPSPSALSFYQDWRPLSTGLLSPPSTLLCGLLLAGLAALSVALIRRAPLVALGLQWFFVAHAMTGTIIPLEIAFEHRNYFASAGIWLSLVALAQTLLRGRQRSLSMALAGLALLWQGSVSLSRSLDWSDPVRFAVTEAQRLPDSAVAQYELGWVLRRLSGDRPETPQFAQARQAFERAMRLPGSSALPDMALIFLDHAAGQAPAAVAWSSLEAKLRARPSDPANRAAVRQLLACQINGPCPHWPQPMLRLYGAMLSHGSPAAGTLSDYAQFAAYVLGDQALARQVARDALALAPNDPRIRRAMTPLLDGPRDNAP